VSNTKLDCTSLSEVTDITSQCSYDDKKSGDSISRVSCCQDDGYNELENKLKTYIKENPALSEQDILQAMCKCCNDIEQQSRTHKVFDDCVSRILFEILKGK